jgi:hypothetical protein
MRIIHKCEILRVLLSSLWLQNQQQCRTLGAAYSIANIARAQTTCILYLLLDLKRVAHQYLRVQSILSLSQERREPCNNVTQKNGTEHSARIR